MKVLISVFWGAKHFNYKSSIIPMIGDIMPNIKQFEEEHFTVVSRIYNPIESDGIEGICINVEKTFPKK